LNLGWNYPFQYRSGSTTGSELVCVPAHPASGTFHRSVSDPVCSLVLNQRVRKGYDLVRNSWVFYNSNRIPAFATTSQNRYAAYRS